MKRRFTFPGLVSATIALRAYLQHERDVAVFFGVSSIVMFAVWLGAFLYRARKDRTG